MSDAYLEHFGVKGMRWGVRKGHSEVEPKTPMSKRTKVAVGVSTGLAIATGAAFVASSLMNSGSKSASSLPRYSTGNLDKVTRLMEDVLIKSAMQKSVKFPDYKW